MRLSSTHDGAQLKCVNSSACFQSIFGLGMTAFAVVVLFASRHGALDTTFKGQRIPPSPGVATGVTIAASAFALLGVLILLLRGGVTFDRAARTANRWYTLLAPIRSTVHDISAFQSVEIASEVRVAPSDSRHSQRK